MRNRACLTALLVVVSQALTPVSPASAQERDAVTDMARRRFQEGVKYFDQKRYEEARAAFLQAYALKHHPAVLLNLAQSETRSGHQLEAARHFATFLRESPASSAAERGEAEKALAAARSKLSRVQIAVNVAGAEVLVDGEVVGLSPLAEPVDVNPGNHTVEAKLAGHIATSNFSVALGKVVATSLAIDAGSVTAAPGAATPLPAPTTPIVPPIEPEPSDGNKAPPPSDTSVSVSSEGREPFFHWLTHNPAGLVGLGVTVAGLGVGVGFGVAASAAKDNADSVDGQIESEWTRLAKKAAAEGRTMDAKPADFCDPSWSDYSYYAKACGLRQDDLDKHDANSSVSTIGFVAAGVGAVGTVTMYFLTTGDNAPSSPSAPQAIVVPVMGQQTTGLAIVGRF